MCWVMWECVRNTKYILSLFNRAYCLYSDAGIEGGQGWALPNFWQIIPTRGRQILPNLYYWNTQICLPYDITAICYDSLHELQFFLTGPVKLMPGLLRVCSISVWVRTRVLKSWVWNPSLGTKHQKAISEK